MTHHADEIRRLAHWHELAAIGHDRVGAPIDAKKHRDTVDMLRDYAESMEDAERYRWLRDRAVLFEYPDGSKGSPYACYDLGLGDTNPTWGTELDSMLAEAMKADAEVTNAPSQEAAHGSS